MEKTTLALGRLEALKDEDEIYPVMLSTTKAMNPKAFPNVGIHPTLFQFDDDSADSFRRITETYRQKLEILTRHYQGEIQTQIAEK